MGFGIHSKNWLVVFCIGHKGTKLYMRATIKDFVHQQEHNGFFYSKNRKLAYHYINHDIGTLKLLK